jgi:hypothetical protein
MRSKDLIYSLHWQGLELLVTVLLARNRRQPPPTVAAGVRHAELAAELVSLPSVLLAMVCARGDRDAQGARVSGLPVRASRCVTQCVRLGCMGVCWEYCV